MHEVFGKPETLFDALLLLCEAHTSEDDHAGFAVHSVSKHEFVGQSEYIEAWKIVRQQLHRRTEP